MFMIHYSFFSTPPPHLSSLSPLLPIPVLQVFSLSPVSFLPLSFLPHVFLRFHLHPRNFLLVIIPYSFAWCNFGLLCSFVSCGFVVFYDAFLFSFVVLFFFFGPMLRFVTRLCYVLWVSVYFISIAYYYVLCVLYFIVLKAYSFFFCNYVAYFIVFIDFMYDLSAVI